MKRALLGLLAGIAVASAAAQPAAGNWRVAYLSAATAENDKARLEAFRDGLRQLGYLEGSNLAIDERYAGGQPARLAGLAAELWRLKPDVFVVYGSAAGVPAIRKASASVPVVFTVSADPVGERVVSNLARPGGRVTGFSDLHSALVTKRLELLKEFVPSAARIAVMASALSPVNELQLKEIEAASPAFGVAVDPYRVSGAADVERAFKAMEAARPAGLMILGDYLLAVHRRQIIQLATRSKLPTIFTTREASQAGGLMSYGTHFPELWRRCAAYVDKIFKGAKPGDLPIEQPTKFELVINRKTAQSIGIAVPRAVLLRADHVID